MQYTTTVSAGIPEATDPPDLPYLFDAAVAPIDGYLDQYLKDWGYANVALRSGFAYQAGTPMRLRRVGKLVHAYWGITSAGVVADGTARNLGDLPVDYRPAQTAYFTWATSVPTQAARGVVYADGRVEIVVQSGVALSPYYLFPVGASWHVD